MMKITAISAQKERSKRKKMQEIKRASCGGYFLFEKR
jgi:hypothetical protein